MSRLALVALLAAACSCPDRDALVTCDFELEDCNVLLQPGVTRVSTIHPGEHGLAFDGDVSITLSSPEVPRDTVIGVEVVTTCP